MAEEKPIKLTEQQLLYLRAIDRICKKNRYTQGLMIRAASVKAELRYLEGGEKYMSRRSNPTPVMLALVRRGLLLTYLKFDVPYLYNITKAGREYLQKLESV